MKTFFTVSDLNFLDDGENDSLSFIPTADIKNKFSDKVLLHRIFTENIAVVPEPPTYSEVIQKLIDADAQSVDDVAKILSLYNPDDVSEIIQKLIDADAQTATDVIQNSNILAYPYSTNSVIYDYKYLNWKKLGTGTINRLNDKGAVFLDNTGLELTNIFPNTACRIEINLNISLKENKSCHILSLYTTLSTSSTVTPSFIFRYNSTNKKYTVTRLSTNNGTTISATTYDINKYEYNETASITFIKFDDGAAQVRTRPGRILAEIDSTSTFNPRSIRINFPKNTSTTAENSQQIEYFNIKLNSNYEIISQWNP